MGKGKRRFTSTQTTDNSVGSLGVIGVNDLDATTDRSKGWLTQGALVWHYGVGSAAHKKVQSAYLYSLSGTTWTKTNFTASSSTTGAGRLYGVPLGTRNEYNGRPEEVGMLLKGVITVYAFGTPAVGSVVYGSHEFSGQYGFFTFTAPADTGDHKQVFGHCLKIINTASINTVVIYFNPDSYYSIIA
jgi:hypothetical protein